MARTVLWSLVLLFPLPALWAADDKLTTLVKEYQAAQQAVLKAHKDARDDAGRDKVLKDYRKLQLKFADGFLDIADGDPKSDTGFEALTWVLDTAGSGPHSDSLPVVKAINLLRQHHVKNEKAGPVCARLAANPTVEADKFLRELSDENPSRDVQGLACYALGQALAARSEEAFKKKQPERSERLGKDAERFYERVQDKYADVKGPRGTLGELVRVPLFELKHLALGKTAPEIEGEDGTGKKFKLSDYRGQVVLLDFWGNWCGPCRAMYPHNRELMKRLEGKPFVLLGVNSDRDRESIRKVMDKEGNQWRYWFDGGSSTGPIATKYNVGAWPTLLVLDPRGVIRLRSVGNPGNDVLDKLIDELLAEAGKKSY